MRRASIVTALVGLFAGLFIAAPAAQADNTGNEGCTPGYWKNHKNNWYETDTQKIPTSTTLEAAGFDPSAAYEGDTLLQALNYMGGTGLLGAERILLRAAVAAWLNAAHEDVGYPYRRGGEDGIVAMVNDAIASGSRAEMLRVARLLDAANNLGCPL